jgi:starch synthase
MALLYDGTLHFNDGISFMKAGILYANKITTVSPSYAQEILTPQFGEKMEEVLRFEDRIWLGLSMVSMWMLGIRNPILLWLRSTVRRNLPEKLKYKLAIQREMGLREAKDVFWLRWSPV